MPKLQFRKVSARMIAANRRNALKSTGPRTSAGKRQSRLNALKHGGRRNLELEDLTELGEDPRAFEAFRKTLADTLEPSNPLEAQLVADIVGLWWKKGRADRAQAALQERELEKLEADRLRHYHEIHRAPYHADPAEFREVGLRGQKGLGAKYEEAYMAFELLLNLVNQGRWGEALELCDSVYGKQPNWRGYQIRWILAEKMKIEEPTAKGEEKGGGTVESSPDAEKQPETSARLIKELRILILKEMSDVAQEGQLYRKESLSITGALRRSCLAPTDPRWALLTRHEAALERQIERKLKLYFLVKNSFRRLGSQTLDDLLASTPRRR